MNDRNLSQFTVTAIHAALQAGEILRRGFGTTLEISSKPGRQNIVTQYDKASEQAIIATLKEAYPTHAFLAEESGLSSSSTDQILWIIDPLDGTTNFAHEIPIFTISIAAYEKGKGLLGVIYQPMTGELFVAEREQGAYLNGRRLTISQTDQIENSLIVVSFPYDVTSIPILKMEQLFFLVQQGATLRNLGSAALSLAYVAAGKVDAFWMYNLFPWDLAAGQVLIEEAGGIVTFYPSHQQTEHPASHTLASNQGMHAFLHQSLCLPDERG